ncbi:MAG: DUF3429 domain-containing protein [Pseudomonadota bacterium]|nr:DUF3429 domain-containing protein [Pseudomonadota bacterium]
MTKSLTWSGLLPFLACLIWGALNLPSADVAAETVFISYSAVILSFMAGTLWGRASHSPNTQHAPLLIASNIWALLAWVAVLFSQQPLWSTVGLALLALGFIHLYRLEAERLHQALDTEYLGLRKRVTSAVVITHALMILVVVLR